jgi:hypothetical protein
MALLRRTYGLEFEPLLVRNGDGYRPTRYWRGAADDALLTIQCAVRCWFAFVEVELRKTVKEEHDHILQDRWLKANCRECGHQSGWCSDCDRARK